VRLFLPQPHWPSAACPRRGWTTTQSVEGGHWRRAARAGHDIIVSKGHELVRLRGDIGDGATIRGMNWSGRIATANAVVEAGVLVAEVLEEGRPERGITISGCRRH
jgi:hypothetical protein